MKICRSNFLALLACGALFLPRLFAAEAPVLSRILKRAELRVGMSGDQPPLNVKSRTGALIGFEPDVAELLARAMDVELRTVEVPFPRLMSALESGEIDIVMSGMAITSHRALGVKFVAPYVFSGKSILTKSESLAQAADASDLNIEKIRLAALANSTSQSFVEGKLSHASLTTTQNYDEAIKLLTKQEVDAIVADMPVCLFSVMRYPDQGFATLAAPLTLEPIAIAIPANDPQLENLLDNYMSALERMGLLEKFRAKWFEDASWLPELP